MPLAVTISAEHLFLWDPFLFVGTPFEVNRVVVLTFVAAIMCIGFFMYGAARKVPVPRGAHNLAETAYLFVRNNIAIDVIGPEGAKYAPYLASLFFFIFFCNLLEIVPLANFPVTSRLGIPAVLAILSYLIFNIVGIKKQGVLKYIRSSLVLPGVPAGLQPLMIVIELFSTFFIRPLTLAVRLLANMMAGHVLLTVFLLFTEDFLIHNFGLTSPFGLVTLALACLIILFELLVISIQAYIFTVLTAFYISEAIHGHGEADHVEPDEHRAPTRETEGLATT